MPFASPARSSPTSWSPTSRCPEKRLCRLRGTPRHGEDRKDPRPHPLRGPWSLSMRRASRPAGPKGVLFKPFESKELLESIERLLREGTPVPEFRETTGGAGGRRALGFQRRPGRGRGRSGEIRGVRRRPAPGRADPRAILPGGAARPPPPSTSFDADPSTDDRRGARRILRRSRPPLRPREGRTRGRPFLPVDSPPAP